MVKMLELREIVRLVDKSSLEKLEVKNGSLRVLIKKGEAAPIDEWSAQIGQTIVEQSTDHTGVLACEPQVTPLSHLLKSINVGTFQSLVKPGDKVQIGNLLGYCTVIALNLKLEITSDTNGIISEVLVEEGQLIDYGQSLFKITVGKELVHV